MDWQGFTTRGEIKNAYKSCLESLKGTEENTTCRKVSNKIVNLNEICIYSMYAFFVL
jgi:hypothetical protein